MAKGLLGLLVDINDYDARIDRDFAARLEAIIEAAELEAIDGVKNGRRSFAQERGTVDRQCRQGYDQADSERTLVGPPLPKNFGELSADTVCHG